MSIQVRKMQSEDLEEVAKVHIQAFPNQFASRMGKKYVSQMYRYYIDFPTGIALVAIHSKNGDLCGIRAGAGKYLLTDFRKKVALSFLPELLLKSLTDFLIFRTLANSILQKIKSIFGQRLKGIESGIKKEGTVFISQIIAVEEKYRGDLETALALINESERIAQEMGYQKIRGQVYLNNPRALAFDRAIGFKELFRENGYCIIEKELK